ncbi:MAG: cell wall metabolism sensor histidine kinase WalK [Clostridiales bacterium]|nr:cell wall metabolism sensor histidine kinase WalK [Clostridiales bacterium]
MRKKLFGIFMVILFFGVTITGYISYNFTKKIILKNTQDNLKTECKLLEDSFKANSGELDLFVKNMGAIINKRITIINKDGLVLGESETKEKNIENHSDRPEIIDALKSGEGFSTRHSETEDQTMYYYARRVEKDGLVYILRLSVQVNVIENMLLEYLKLLLIAAIAGAIICTVLVYLYVNIITKPIRMLTRLSTTIALGQYEKRISITSKDEIGQLGHAFNIMAKRLQETITELSDKQSKLISILTSMDDGVIVIDNTEKILLINSAAQKLFESVDDLTGKYFIEATRNKEIHELVNAIPDEDVEITINHPIIKYLRIRTKRVINSNENLGVMLFIQDITKIKSLEQMRSDFVANVSHELKSPLTSLKGCAETLKYVEDKPTRDKFLDIIYIESERLTRLINDILTLSDLENKESLINFEKINVNKAAEEIFYIMEPAANSKEISIKLELESKEIFIYGDRDKFKQMMINLVDNGIKYTNKGGKVKIKTLKLDKRVKIIITDNGIGIPKKNISRLFERFYRVDKGRSREMGGTGLGLAIVKHIVQLFDGKISVESSIGNGTSFILDFPSGETDL